MKEKITPAVNTSSFYKSLVLLFAFLALIMYFFPEVVPFGLGELLFFRFSWESFRAIPWTLLLIGPGLTLLGRIVTKNTWLESISTRQELGKNLWTSIKAGIFEEVWFRWLIFFYLIIAFSLDNYLLNWLTSVGWINAIISLPWFAWLLVIASINFIGLIALGIVQDKGTRGCAINSIAFAVLVIVAILDFTIILIFTKFWYTKVLLPIINWLTLGKLYPQLFGFSWMVGAALVSANGKFRDGHSYQGCIGIVNSWVIGMIMFVFTFHFGLFFAMLVHALYDIVITLIVYFDALIDRG